MSALELFWFFTLLAVLGAFAVLDGADLGRGMLALLLRREQRSRLLDSIGPTWYANETWLVIGGALLFATFPAVYSIVLNALYFPVIMLLLGLILRAASTEFRGRGRYGASWDIVMGAGCALAILGIGFLLGGLLTGIRTDGRQFTGGVFDWANWPAAVVALGSLSVFSLIGASYASRDLESNAPGLMPPGVLRSSTILAAAMVVASILGMATRPAYWDRLLSHPGTFWPVCVLAAFQLASLGTAIAVSFRKGGERLVYVLAVTVLVLGGGLVVAWVFPYTVPFSLTLSGSAAPPSSLLFALFGAGVILPLVTAYNVFVRIQLSRAKKQD